jgi:hypothetical protein
MLTGITFGRIKMNYSDFTLDLVIDKFALELHDRANLLGEVESISPSEHLQNTLRENTPIALASNSEKARSEMLIAPVLIELRRQLNHQIALFSGISFSVAPDLGLTGICDFLISRSAELALLKAPIVAIVEAKRENLNAGLGQCLAEMVAAQMFNVKHNRQINTIWGCITSGTNWRFLYLKEKTIVLDLDEYYLSQVDKILGIFHHSLS